jgi:hypothetical protein
MYIPNKIIAMTPTTPRPIYKNLDELRLPSVSDPVEEISEGGDPAP